MNIDQIQLVYEAISEAHEKSALNDAAGADAAWAEAANLALAADGIDETVNTRQEAVELLQTLEKNLANEGKYIEVATLLWGNGMFDSRPSVVRDVFEEVAKNSRLLIMGGSSLSKCLGPDVPVLMFDGSTKKAKDVCVGDVLMGDDHTPRNVSETSVGRGPMFMVFGGNLEWTCNTDHIITLIRRSDQQVVDVELSDYLAWADEKKSDHFMFRAKPGRLKEAFAFRIRPIGDGEYHGFLIDGNHRFLLGDFTVTHNTFSCGVLFYVFWRQDPYWTAVKLAAPTETHLYTNLFSHLVALHRGAVIPMTEDDAKRVQVNETEMFIAMHDALPEMRIQGVLCKQSAVSAGALRGHKPKPYRKPLHPVFGNSTRLFILIDEGSQVSPGAFEDIRTTEASIDESIKNVKIVIPFNPERIDQKVVQMAEPPDGWDIEQVDTLYKYISKQGYPVLRLDGKRFENVVERRVIYPRMLTYEAFLDFLKAGEHSGVYWAKGRGFPPLKDNAWTVVPPAWVQSQRGEPIYTGTPKSIAALDTALAGSDKALLGIGRWGEASGWTKINGEVEWFVSRADPTTRITKHVAVLDQIFHLPKTNSTVEIIQEVMGRCKGLGIPPENVAMDCGGNAGGVWSHARKFWGDVLGVDSGTRASESKVLAEDQLICYDMYHLKVTELWFAMKRWLEPTVCAVLINAMVPTGELFMQLTTRRYRNIKGGKVQVEPKHEWRHRNNGKSPDEADIFNLLVEWCRERGGVTPGIQEKAVGDGGGDGWEGPMSLESADEPETISDAEWEPNRLE